MRFRSRKYSYRQAMTLVELLVVITIMLLLAMVGVPALQPMMESRQTREAARAVNVFLGAARDHARETRRPHGVWIERFDLQRQAAFTLYQAEVPPPYAGGGFNSTVTITRTGASGGYINYRVDITTPTEFDQNLVRVGDRFQINHQGPWYEITGPNTDGDSEGYLDASPFNSFTVHLAISTIGSDNLWLTTSNPMPFRIMRQPVKSTLAPLQLPGSAVIDLYESGTGGMPFEPSSPNDARPVIIMFSPNGNVDSIYCRDVITNPTNPNFPFWTESRPTGPVFFLIGRRDRLPDTVPTVQPRTVSNPTADDPAPSNPTAEDGLRNWQDLNNLWVTVHPRTGLVTSIENALCDVTAIPTSLTPPFDYNLRQHRLWALSVARSYAVRGHSMGGR